MITPPLFEGFSREIDTTERHHIEWTFDRDTVTGRTVCESGADANCRLTADCDCESWHIERDQTGAAYHLATEYDHLLDGVVEARHPMKVSESCNVKDWLDAGDLEESAVGLVEFVIARTPIVPVWNDDHFLWEPATEVKA